MMLDVWWHLFSMGFFDLEQKKKIFVGHEVLNIRVAL